MGTFADVSGQKFGRLFAVRRVANDRASGNAAFLCKCDCGDETIVKGSHLRTGHTRSCGCLFVDHGGNHTHGATGTTEHDVWRGMLQRCRDMENEGYGGRGISVCDRWLIFKNFLMDMGARPSPRHSIERLENGGNYESGNCVWATSQQQGRNKRNNILVDYSGRLMVLSEAAEIAGVDYRRAWARINAGWDIRRALTP